LGLVTLGNAPDKAPYGFSASVHTWVMTLGLANWIYLS
jgi:hypothetical protein